MQMPVLVPVQGAVTRSNNINNEIARLVDQIMLACAACAPGLITSTRAEGFILYVLITK
jgi:hypothetical protein